MQDGKILAGVNEERITRKKTAYGFPRSSIQAVLNIAGVKPSDINHVAVATKNDYFSDEIKPWEGSHRNLLAAKERHTDWKICIMHPITGKFINWWEEKATRIYVVDVAKESRVADDYDHVIAVHKLNGLVFQNLPTIRI